VLQETYLQVWRVAPTYAGTLSPPMAWMGVLLRSRALDLLRRRATQRMDRTTLIDAELEDSIATEDAGPHQLADASQQALALHECLRKLEARQREVVSLAYLRDLSHGDLARQLGLPLGTVKSWIRRGIDQLRGCLARFA
jgi:RNA polymerase sigma factor (sigma-70 family)